jgi:hypothetical protein
LYSVVLQQEKSEDDWDVDEITVRDRHLQRREDYAMQKWITSGSSCWVRNWA